MADIEGFGIDPLRSTPGELLRSIEDLVPGPLVMSTLLMIDRSALDADDAVRYLRIHDRVASWWAALQADALVAATGPSALVSEFLALDPRPDHDAERTIRIEDAAREEVAAALRWSPATAQRSMDHARLLAGPLRETRDCLELGEISSMHARVICEAAERLSSRDADDEQFTDECAALQQRVLRMARRSTISRTKACLNRAVEAIDAAGQARRRQRARCTRDVQVSPDVDGIATLVARLDALTAHAIMRAVNAAAAGPVVAGAPGATAGERRAEALAALILGSTADGACSDAPDGMSPGVRLDVTLDVTIPVTALQASSDEPSAITVAGLPVEFAEVRRLLDDPAVQAHLRPVITDEHGHILDLGRRRYEISAALRRFIVARDRVCRFPGCGRSAEFCQIDHATSWDDGGASDASNLGALCVRHHQLKTHGGWDIIESARDGSCTWRSPQGRIHSHVPLALAGQPPPPF